ncbi:hypothetical protein BJF82_15760 [Kytococcus sp. CUA-901]|nr:hypothetical protein BJF82_15760 [Kytococcus sp. CUA-901]
MRRWAGFSGTETTCSIFGGRSAATDSLVRRSTRGRMRRRSVSSSSGAVPDSMGRRKTVLKRSGELNSPGATMDSSAHRSMSEFSSGVPVTAIFTGARSRRATW